MTFQTQVLMDNRVLVHGTDVFGSTNKTIVDGTQWAELTERTDVDKAQQAFDEAVNQFFKPVLDAAEELREAFDSPADSIAYVVIEEGSEGVAPTPRHVVPLTRDSIILRLIEEDETDRLMWVGDSLEILKAPAAYSGTAPVAANESDEAARETEAQGFGAQA